MEPIKERKLIIAEGDDDKDFLSAFIKEMALLEIQIVSVWGVDGWAAKITAVKNSPGFDSIVESLGIVRDSDSSAESAFESTCYALEKNALSIPSEPLVTASGKPKVIVMLWPCYQDRGCIEDICLKSVSGSQEMVCVESFFRCLRDSGMEMPKNLSKAKVQAFLASKRDTYPKLGVAAKKKYWPMDNKVFDDVKKFLKAL